MWTPEVRAASAGSLQTQATVSSIGKSLRDVTKVLLPGEIGTIDEFYLGNSGKTFILIQDAHAVPDAQRSIEKIIRFFQSEYGVDTVGLEGAASALDPQFFRSYTDRERLEKVFGAYTEAGEMAGATAASIFGPERIRYEGVEDWSLYEEALGYFRDAADRQTDIFPALDGMAKDLESLKTRIYSAELLSLDGILQRFRANDTGLPEVLNELAAMQAPEQGSDLALIYRQYLREESSSSEESSEIQGVVRKILTALERQKPDEEITRDLARLNTGFQNFQTGQMGSQSLALLLKELAVKYRVRVKVSAGMNRLAAHEKKMRDIRGTKLYREFELYARKVKESLFRNDAERDLDRRVRMLETLRRLASLELSSEDWSRIKQYVRGVHEWTLQADGIREAGDMTVLLRRMRPNLEFYRTSEKRDGVFLAKLVSLTEKRKTDASMLVAGGFHTEGLARRLKAKGISYLVIVPDIRSIPDNLRYREQMRGEVSWSDYFEVKNGKVNLYDAFVRAARDKLLADGPALLLSRKQWRDQIIRDLAEKNELARAAGYTRFLDEISPRDPGIRRAAASERFAQGLRDLAAKGQVTAQNIFKLLAFKNAQPAVLMPLARGELRADLIGKFSARVRKPAPASVQFPARPEIRSAAQPKLARETAARRPQGAQPAEWHYPPPDQMTEEEVRQAADRVSAMVRDTAAAFAAKKYFGNKRNLRSVKRVIYDLTQLLRKYPVTVAMNFLNVLRIYLDNEIPEAALFEGFDDTLLDGLTNYSGKFHLWTEEAITQFSARLWKKIEEVHDQTGKMPAVIEVAAGYGDLSQGIKEKFAISQGRTGVRIFPTDGFYSEVKPMAEGESLYDRAMVEQRGVLALTTAEIADGSFRRKLDLPEDTPVIVIASHLPEEGNVEELLLNQTHVADLMLVEGYSPKTGIKGVGQKNIRANAQVWDIITETQDPTVWYSGVMSQEGRLRLKLVSLSRRSDAPEGLAGSVPAIATSFSTPSWGASGAVGASLFLHDFFSVITKMADDTDRRQRMPTLGQLLDKIQTPAIYPFKPRPIDPSKLKTWADFERENVVTPKDFLDLLAYYVEIRAAPPDLKPLIAHYEKIKDNNPMTLEEALEFLGILEESIRKEASPSQKIVTEEIKSYFEARLLEEYGSALMGAEEPPLRGEMRGSELEGLPLRSGAMLPSNLTDQQIAAVREVQGRMESQKNATLALDAILGSFATVYSALAALSGDWASAALVLTALFSFWGVTAVHEAGHGIEAAKARSKARQTGSARYGKIRYQLYPQMLLTEMEHELSEQLPEQIDIQAAGSWANLFASFLGGFPYALWPNLFGAFAGGLWAVLNLVSFVGNLLPLNIPGYGYSDGAAIGHLKNLIKALNQLKAPGGFLRDQPVLGYRLGQDFAPAKSGQIEVRDFGKLPDGAFLLTRNQVYRLQQIPQGSISEDIPLIYEVRGILEEPYTLPYPVTGTLAKDEDGQPVTAQVNGQKWALYRVSLPPELWGRVKPPSRTEMRSETQTEYFAEIEAKIENESRAIRGLLKQPGISRPSERLKGEAARGRVNRKSEAGFRRISEFLAGYREKFTGFDEKFAAEAESIRDNFADKSRRQDVNFDYWRDKAIAFFSFAAETLARDPENPMAAHTGGAPANEQIQAALVMQNNGTIANMLPSEGKTLAFALAAYLKALSGVKVEMHGWNNPLAARDAQMTGMILERLGFKTAVFLQGKPYRVRSPEERGKKRGQVVPEYPCLEAVGTGVKGAALANAGRELYRESDVIFEPFDQMGFKWMEDWFGWFGEGSPVLPFREEGKPVHVFIDEADTPLLCGQ
ncbi:MAG: hypothetical protein WC352_02815 [Candidatus Omnitrophota bacterium]